MAMHDIELEAIIHSDAVLIIDTWSLLEYAFLPFSKRAEPVLQASGKQLILPAVTVHEIEKNAKKNQRLENGSKRALTILVDLKKKGLLDVVGDELLPLLRRTMIWHMTCLVLILCFPCKAVTISASIDFRKLMVI